MLTQPLNYTTKAIEAFANHPLGGEPGSAAGLRYLRGLLMSAQVFVLSSHGELLPRDKPRPEIPGLMLKPPFPVTALEYQARAIDWNEGFYSASKCSRRISLAWDYSDDLPPALRRWLPARLGPGVMIASIPWYDDQREWIPIPVAAHIPYDVEWGNSPPTPHLLAMTASGRVRNTAIGLALKSSNVMLMPEPAMRVVAGVGGFAVAKDAWTADLMDEVNAYLDLCYALACKNVSTRQEAAPPKLNKARIASGRLPFKDFHVLELAGSSGSFGGAGGSHASPRAHLRRGHIRRLGPARMTWVNQAMVRGKGFVDKVYAL